MLEKDRQLVVKFKQQLETITEVRRMIVFGSRARGDFDFGSDLDIFVELPNLTSELRERIFNIAWEISFENEIVISTLLASSNMLIDSPLAGNPILRIIHSEGIAV